MHLADLTDYARAQAEVAKLYENSDGWTRKAVINVGCSGKVSSDRTIGEYATHMWKVEPVPVNSDAQLAK
jgi:glycogen phosphorylase